jgi:transcription antitermination factor NusG
MPQAEQSVVKHLSAFDVESFLPTFEATHVWKNRQRKTFTKPLFPCYVFVHVTRMERPRIFRSPDVIRIVGGMNGPIPIPSEEIERLRTVASRNSLEPFPEIVLGTKVRVQSGPMRGIEGTLVRRKSSLKLVISIGIINQHAALEINADEIEVIQS